LVSSSEFFSISSLNLKRTLALTTGGLLDQSLNAFLAFSTARFTSAFEAKLTLEVSSPVAGLYTFPVLFEDPSKILPSTKWFN